MLQNPIVGIGLYSLLLAAGQAMFKLAAIGAKSLNDRPLQLIHHLLSTPVFLTGCFLYALSTIFWVALLTRHPLSQVYPLVIAISIVLTVVLGMVIFGERITAGQVLGYIVIIAGIGILSRSL